MKRFLLSLVVAGSLIFMSSFKEKDTVASGKDNVNSAVSQSFTSNFKNAREVKWTSTSNYYKASFTMNGQYINAFFDTDGRMIGVSRNISPVQLPVTLQTSLKKDYDGYWISDLMEFGSEDGTTYYVTLENAETQVILKSSSDVFWSTYKKQRKS